MENDSLLAAGSSNKSNSILEDTELYTRKTKGWENMPVRITMNKNVLTHLIALTVIGLGYASPWYREQIQAVGFFALSGAVTNWLAVHMLFEKVPLLYGSGVIPRRFESFKEGLRALIMEQFFTPKNLERFWQGTGPLSPEAVSWEPMVEALDDEQIWQNLLTVVQDSPLGQMLGMVGGSAVFESLKAPLLEKFKTVVLTATESPMFQQAVKQTIFAGASNTKFLANIEQIVMQRLEELTPQMVKDIVQEMIEVHLGWLVVWGGVIGGAMGLVLTVVAWG